MTFLSDFSIIRLDTVILKGVRGEYTLLLSNFIVDITFKGMLNYDQKSPFLRKSQKTCFLPLFVRNKLKINKNSKKFMLNCFLDIKHPLKCCIFSIEMSKCDV